MTRNACLAALIAIASGLSAASCEQRPNTSGVHDLAVYSEMSPNGLKKIAPGWNTRVFNTADVKPPADSSISVDTSTGYITLKRGTYHITASSQVTYNDLKVDPSAPGWITHERPNGGYARLRDASLKPDPTTKTVGNEDAIIVGTISNANMVPSLIDTYYTVTADSITLLIEHQVGEVIDTIYLQDNTAGTFTSKWHVFARIAIRKL